jgi:hypothetical protein
MRADGDELREPFGCFRNGVGPRDAERRKAEAARGVGQLRPDESGIVQKSRLA